MANDPISDVAQALLDCVCADLADGECGCPCWAFIANGAVAWDHCCDDGQLWVSVDRVYPYGIFPSAPTSRIACAQPIAVDYTIGILRCAPVSDDQGNPPTPEQLTASGIQVTNDMYTIMNSVICCLDNMGQRRLFTIAGTRPLGPSGGCVGSALTVTVAVT